MSRQQETGIAKKKYFQGVRVSDVYQRKGLEGQQLQLLLHTDRWREGVAVTCMVRYGRCVTWVYVNRYSNIDDFNTILTATSSGVGALLRAPLSAPLSVLLFDRFR